MIMSISMERLKELTYASKQELNAYMDYILSLEMTHNERVTVSQIKTNMNANMDAILALEG